MASLWALLSAPDALSAYEWLTRLARGMGAEDPRGMDARRADLLTALLTGRLTVAAPDSGGSAALADFVRARDVHCRHPGCRRRAIDSELDRTVAYAGDGGQTSAANPYGACPHHHHLKHDAPGWSVVQHVDGRITWTTPTGRSYTSAPYDYRVEDEPDPMTGGVHPRLELEPPPTSATGDAEPPF